MLCETKAMNSLRLERYKFFLRFAKATYLPPFIGNTIRGALGYALEEIGPNKNRNAYEDIFKTKPGVSIPNPYAISVPYSSKESYDKGDELIFGITLFGYACGYSSEIIVAAENMCNGKLRNATYCGVEKVYARQWSDSGAESIPQIETLTINFLTPTEILRNKTAIEDLSFDCFIDSLFGRIGGIIDNYTDSLFMIPYSYVAAKPFVRSEQNLRHIQFQTSGQPISGFVGTVRYFGDVTRYLPYIDLGSQLHVGKKTTRACGEYSFDV